jgi:hypothetical protein
MGMVEVAEAKDLVAVVEVEEEDINTEEDIMETVIDLLDVIVDVEMTVTEGTHIFYYPRKIIYPEILFPFPVKQYICVCLCVYPSPHHLYSFIYIYAMINFLSVSDTHPLLYLYIWTLLFILLFGLN